MGGRRSVVFIFCNYCCCCCRCFFVVEVVVVVVVFFVVEVVVDNIVICRSASGPSAPLRVGKELGSEHTGVELVR